MSRRERSLEEIITLQDQAIQALQQATAAMKLALETIQAARNEQGYRQSIPFGVPSQFPQNPPYQPWGGDGTFTLPQWDGSGQQISYTLEPNTAGLNPTNAVLNGGQLNYAIEKQYGKPIQQLDEKQQMYEAYKNYEAQKKYGLAVGTKAN